MKVTVHDPTTFIGTEVEIDDMSNTIAAHVRSSLSGLELPDGSIVTQMIYKEDGSIAVGMIIRGTPENGGPKKFRITIEKFEG